MMKIQLTTSSIRVSTEGKDNPYVFYSGHVAGVTDRSTSQSDTESFDRRTDEVQLNRNGVNRV